MEVWKIKKKPNQVYFKRFFVNQRVDIHNSFKLLGITIWPWRPIAADCYHLVKFFYSSNDHKMFAIFFSNTTLETKSCFQFVISKKNSSIVDLEMFARMHLEKRCVITSDFTLRFSIFLLVSKNTLDYAGNPYRRVKICTVSPRHSAKQHSTINKMRLSE